MFVFFFIIFAILLAESPNTPGEGRKSSVSPRATGGNEFAGKGQNVEERKETKVAGRAEEDIGRVEDIDVGGERRVKRARTQEKLEGEQAASS